MRSFKLTEKYQSTIPNDVRNFLHLKKGDRVTFKIENNKVILDKLSYSDYEYLNSLSNTLTEWSSIEDEEAYNDL
jgi:AbrB family looped-hinge helix DNA binding protein